MSEVRYMYYRVFTGIIKAERIMASDPDGRALALWEVCMYV